MKICKSCIKDPELKSMIECETQGKCSFCNKNALVYDTDIDHNDNLINSLEEFFDIYTIDKLLPFGFPSKKKRRLQEEIFTKWKLFNVDTQEKVYEIITSICSEKYKENKDLFDNMVGIPELIDDDFLKENSIIKKNSWEEFCSILKNDIRFHTDYINLNILNYILNNVVKVYSKGSHFFRARISPNGEKYNCDEMGPPPCLIATDGRANPAGISYLYLSDKPDTTAYEVRASINDYMTIGKFSSEEELKLIDLSSIDKISPFCGIDQTIYAVNLETLKKISTNISKPLNSTDSKLDYLPTQYIVDFIKSKGYDGIEYNSTLNPEGSKNFAIFDASKLTCSKTTLYKIGLKYSFEEISDDEY
ncbi:RES family NAD+ phosphorylase [Intestinibacter bartlettii]|uniref:RES family NAD+ phosphorylase n=1 Tax=Intestinibacter bartlettii TaxID=261299 RepID=UPI00082309C0|nr:RES family NAD+ phosphorylase [Intestinibacter bartlettii]SCI39645.1 RES domain [uncultured Clostridium sp.]